MNYDVHESGKCSKPYCAFCDALRKNEGYATEKSLILLNLAKKDKYQFNSQEILESKKPR